jgi:hypothetical protein
MSSTLVKRKKFGIPSTINYVRTVRVPLGLEVRIQLLQHASLAKGYYRLGDDLDSMFGFWFTGFEFVSGAFLWFFFLCPE